MAENEINISIKTESDLKAVDQLIARMKHMREEIGKMSRGLKIGSEFAKEINQAIAANKKLEGSVKSLARTQAAARREEEKGDRAYIQMHRRMIRENDQLARTEKRRQQSVDNMTRSYSGLTLSLKKAASLSSGLMKTLNQQESVARRLTAVEKERAKAETNLANAKKKYDDLIRKGGASQQELHDAKELLALADRQEKAVQARSRAIKNEMTTLKSAKESYDRLGETIKKIEASGKKAPEQLVRQYHALGEQVKAVERQFSTAGDAQKRLASLTSAGVTQGIANVRKMVPELRDTLARLKREYKDYDDYIRNLGKETAAYNKMRDAIEEGDRKEELRRQKEYETFAKQQADAEKKRLKDKEQQQKWYMNVVANSFKKEEQMQQQAAKAAQAANRARVQALDSFKNSLRGLSQSLANITGTINRFLTLMGAGFSRAMVSASNAVGRLTSTASSGLAKLSSYLASTGRNFLAFGNIIGRSMKSGTDAMQRFYSAGFSMLASGAILNQFGDRIFGMMGNMLNNYMEYEKMLTRTAISAALPSNVAGQYPEGPYGGEQVRPDFIQQMIFGLQRGEFGKPVMGFDAKELAQGLYYYTSAIGQEITPDNMANLGPIIADILQVASATQTSPETMIKGVMNTAMEFGIRPEQAAQGDPEMLKWFENLAAQMGFLANITTMEVPDIAETFKMVGPMAHILTDRNTPGAGLNEMFALTALASEMGLRGGNVGRGINQALTTLLDPTQPAIEAAAKAFGIGASEEAFREFFFNAEGELEGGLPGLFDKFAQLPAETAAPLLASLFTTNATRSILAIEQAIREGGDMRAMIERVAGMDAQQWAQMATDAVNQTLYGSFTNMKNAWFEVQAAIVDGVKGPLIGAFNALADVFRMIADALTANPILVKFIASIVTATAVVASLTGGLLFFMGTLLLLARGLAMVGAAGRPFLILLTALPRLLFILSPLMLLIAGTVAALHTAWTNNFLGMQDAVRGFIDGFTIEQDVVPKLLALLTWVQRIGRAFTELINGILIGIGPTNNLAALLQSVFGPLLGSAFYAALLNFSKGLDGVRTSFVNLIKSLGAGGKIFENIGRSIQGFLESFFLGQRQEANMYAQSVLGRILGIDNLPSLLKQAANATRSFVMTAIGYFGLLKEAIFGTRQAIANLGFGPTAFEMPSIADNIRNNIASVFNSFDGGRIREILGSLFTGIGQGFAAAMIGAAKAVEVLTKALADAGKAGDWINDYLEKWLDFRVTITNIAQAIGVAIGTWLGARLVTMILPGVDVLLRFGLALAQIGIMGAGAVIQVALFVARIIAMTLAFAAQVAITMALVGARLALFAITTAITIVQALMNTQQAMTTTLQGAGTAITITQTVANTGLASSFGLIAAAIGLVIAAFVLLIGVGITLFAVIGTITAVAIGYLAITQGLYAAWNALVSVWNGFMLVMSPLISVIKIVTTVIMALINTIVLITGASDAFYIAGIAMAASLVLVAAGVAGLMLVLVAFLTVLAAVALTMASIAVVMLLPITPMIAFIAVLAKFGVVDDIVNGVVNAFEWMGGMVKEVLSVAKEAFLAFTDATELNFKGFASHFLSMVLNVVDGLNLLIDAANKAAGLIPGIDGMGNIDTSGLKSLIASFEQDQYRKLPSRDLSRVQDPVGGGQKKSVEDGISKFKEFIGDVLERSGIDTMVEDFFGKSMQDFSMDDFTKLLTGGDLNIPGYDQFDLYSIMPGLEEYQTQVEEYQEWQRVVNAVGLQQAEEMYRWEGKAIPVKPPSFQAYVEGMVSGSDEALDEMNRIIQEWDQFNADFTGAIQDIDLPTALQAAFSKTPDQGMTLAAFLGANASSIVGTLQEAAPWMNEVELLMDAAIEGGLSKGVYGVNVHKALEKPLKGVAQETGVSVEDMLKDIPTYVADEKYIPMAITQMMQGIGQLPPQVRQDLDNLGQDIGKSLSWEELSRYAVSQEQAGNFDWTFVDFLSDQWDMTVNEVTDYIHSKGIDVTDVQRALFPEELRDYILAAGGEVSVLTQEAYDYALSHTYGPDDTTIEVTKREWAALDEAAKIGLSNMGYTFIVGGNEAAAQAQTSAQNILDSFRNTWGGDDPSGARFQVIPDEVIANLENGYIRLKNLDTGEIIEVPAVEYAAYQESVQEVQRITNELAGIFKNPFGSTGDEKVRGDGTAIGDGTGMVGDASSLVDRVMGNVIDVEIKTTVDGKSPTDAGTELGKEITEGAATSIKSSGAIKKAIQEEVQAAASSLQTSASGYAGTGAGSPAGVATGPFDSLFKGYGVSAAKAFVDSVRENMTFESTGTGPAMVTSPFDSQFSGYGMSAATAFKNAFSSSMAGWTPTMGTATYGENGSQDPARGYTPAPSATSLTTTYTATVTVDHSQFDAEMGRVFSSLNGFNAMEMAASVTVDHSLFDTEMGRVFSSLNGFDKMVMFASVSVDKDQFDTRMSAVNTSLYNFDARHVYASVDATDLASAVLDIINPKLDTYDQRSVSATVSLIGASGVQSSLATIISQMNNLSGKTATSTVNLVTNKITNTASTVDGGSDGNPATPYARGGLISSRYQLMGEEGMEIASLPMGGKVFDAQQTSRLLSQATQFAHMVSNAPRDETRTVSQQGDVKIEIGQIVLHKDVDVDRALAKIDKYLGRKTELARRGMIPFDGNRTM